MYIVTLYLYMYMYRCILTPVEYDYPVYMSTSILYLHVHVLFIILQRSADSLGEDDLSEDLERLKASLEAEREETLNKSARLIPDKK